MDLLQERHPNLQQKQSQQVFDKGPFKKAKADSHGVRILETSKGKSRDSGVSDVNDL